MLGGRPDWDQSKAIRSMIDEKHAELKAREYRINRE
jgi:hypothetical protein